MRLFWSRVECEAAVGSNVRSVPKGRIHQFQVTGHATPTSRVSVSRASLFFSLGPMARAIENMGK